MRLLGGKKKKRPCQSPGARRNREERSSRPSEYPNHPHLDARPFLFLRVPLRNPPRLVCFPLPPDLGLTPILGGYVEGRGMVLISALALKKLPSRRFSPSPSCSAVGPVKTMVGGCIHKTGKARTVEA